MKARYLGALIFAAVATNACSDRNGPSTSSLSASLVSSYEATDDVPAGGITVISFTSDGHYALRRSLDVTVDEIIARETGTFTIGATTLTLTPDDGSAPVTTPFQIETSGASEQGSLTGQSVHAQDLGDIRIILSFVLGEQHFYTEAPVTDDGADDAGAGDAGCIANAISGDGIDVSHHNGSVDWKTVSASQSFAYAKATEGMTYVDPTFATNFAAIKAAGMKRGAYHFFRVERDPVAQADSFAMALQANAFDASTDLPPVVDVELYANFNAFAPQLVTNLRAFINEAQSKLGTPLMIYTGPSFWRDHTGSADFSTNALWIANYGVTQPHVPKPWTSYSVWQSTESGSIAGVKGHVDIDHAGPAGSASDGGTSCGSDGGNVLGDADGGMLGDDAGDASMIPGTCGHDVCTAGEKLGQACTSCTMKVCAHDAYCCDTYWGVSCFQDVQQYCGVTCP